MYTASWWQFQYTTIYIIEGNPKLTLYCESISCDGSIRKDNKQYHACHRKKNTGQARVQGGGGQGAFPPPLEIEKQK